MARPKKFPIVTREILGYHKDKFRVSIYPHKSILIEKIEGWNTGHEVLFCVGNECVTGSFNLIYTDKILDITDKTVSYMDMGRLRRVKLARFVNRNWDYDAQRIKKHNDEMSQMI